MKKRLIFLLFQYISLGCLAQIPRADSLITYCFEIRYSNPQQAKVDCEAGIRIAQTNNHDTLEAKGLIILGLVEKGQSNYEEALRLYREGIEIREKLKDTSGIASTYSNIGRLYEEWGKYALSLEANLTALNLIRQTDNKGRLASILINTSNAYSWDGDIQKAIEFLLEAISVYKEIDNPYQVAICHDNLANRYRDLEDYKKAKRDYNIALNLYQEHGDEQDIGLVHNALGIVYMNQENVDSSRYHLFEAAKYFEIWEEEKVGWSDVYVNLAQLERQLGNPEKSKDYLFTAQEILADNGGLYDEWYLKDAWAQTYAMLQQYDSAYTYQKVAEMLNDSIFNLEKTTTIETLQTEYEVKIKDQENANLTAWANKSTLQRNLFIGLSALLLFLITGIIYLFKQRNKTRNLLAQQKDQLHQQEVEELVLDQEVKVYQSILEGQETERKRLAAELHDRVGGTLTGLKWQFEAFAEGQETDEAAFSKTRSLLDQTYQEVREISHTMAGGNSVQFGLEESIRNLINAAHRPGHLEVELITFGLEKSIPGEIEIEAYKLLQELVSNVLKHAKASTLNVQLERIEDQLNITVEDNGKGFDPDKTEKKGLGLGNIETRLENLKGNLNIDSGRGGGTTIMIEIPLPK